MAARGAISSARPGARRRARGGEAKAPEARGGESRAGRWLRRAAGAFVVGLLFAEVVAFGGSRSDVGLAFAALQMALPLAFLALDPGFRVSQSLAHRAPVILALFVALEAWAAFTLLPLRPVGYDAVRQAFGPAMSIDRAATVTEMVKLAGLAGLFTSGLLIAGRPRAAWRAFDLLAVAATGYAVWAIWAYVRGPDVIFSPTGGYDLHRRLSASFLSPNTAGSLFGGVAMLFAVGASAIVPSRSLRTGRFKVSRRARLSSVAFPAAVLTGLAALWMTASRGAVLATGVVLTISVAALLGRRVAAWRGRPVSRVALVLVGALVALVLIVGLPLTTGGVAAWRFGYAQATALERGETGRWLLGLAAQHPLSGFGLGTFREALKAHMDAAAFPLVWAFGAAHDIALQWVIEGGLIGTLIMFALAGLILTRLASRALSRGEAAARARAVLAFSGVLLIHNLVDFSLQIPAVAGLWAFLLGLGLGGTHASPPRPTPLSADRDDRQCSVPM